MEKLVGGFEDRSRMVCVETSKGVVAGMVVKVGREVEVVMLMMVDRRAGSSLMIFSMEKRSGGVVEAFVLFCGTFSFISDNLSNFSRNNEQVLKIHEKLNYKKFLF